jgi:hypothetical protein
MKDDIDLTQPEKDKLQNDPSQFDAIRGVMQAEILGRRRPGLVPTDREKLFPGNRGYSSKSLSGFSRFC